LRCEVTRHFVINCYHAHKRKRSRGQSRSSFACLFWVNEHLGTTELTIWVNLPNLDAQDFQLASSAYVSKLFAAIRERFKFESRDKLVVHTKDADNKPYSLDNAKLTLTEALCNSKRNPKGEYDIYVEVPPKEIAAADGNLRSLALANWFRSSLRANRKSHGQGNCTFDSTVHKACQAFRDQ